MFISFRGKDLLNIALRVYFLKLAVELFDLALYDVLILMLFTRKYHFGNMFDVLVAFVIFIPHTVSFILI